MRPTIRQAVAGAGVAALVVTLAACGGGGGGEDSGSSGGKPQKGGTIIMRNFGEFEHLDPQRSYVGADISFISRTLAQTLTTFPPKKGAASAELIADAATDTGTATNNNQTWTFTLRDGLKWQDGTDVTCEDFKYGVSRTFAVDQITGGPNYAIQWLDIPTKGDGTSKYPGPYKASKSQQALYDKAVVCDGNKITFHLNSPHVDFNQTVSYPAFSPIKESKDTGTKYDFTPFSSGPYKLQGEWDKKKCGTLVRNENWQGAKADGGVRKAYPDKIVVDCGDQPQTIAQALISDSGDSKNTVTFTRVDPSQIAAAQNSADAKERLTEVPAPYTDYLFFNMTSSKMKDQKVRNAVATAIDREAYATASGGSSYMDPANGGVINPTLPEAFQEFDPFDAGSKGNPEKAKQMLQEAGVKTPLTLTYTWRGSPTQDKAAASIQDSLKKAGINVKLKKVPASEPYYSKIQTPDFLADVDFGWTSWGADWPSGSTVVPALYTGGQVGKESRGQNYGGFVDPDFDKRVQEVFKIKDNAKAQKEWSKLDQEVIERGVVYPLGYNKFPYLRGSNIKGYVINQAMGCAPDFATLAVK